MPKIMCLAQKKEIELPNDCYKCPHFAGNVCQHPETRAEIEKKGYLAYYFEKAWV